MNGYEFSDEFRDVVIVIDVATGEERGVAHYNDDIGDLYWLPNQERLLLVTLSYSGTNRTELLSWSPGEQRPRRLSQETMPNYIKGAVSPDGRLVAVTGHTTSSIRLIDTDRGNVVNTLHNEATKIDTLTFSEDGQRIIACSTSGEVLSWDLGLKSDLFALQTKPLRQLADNGFALSKDQSLLAIVHSDGAIIVRTREGKETVLKPGNPAAGASNLRFSDDNRYLAHRTIIVPDRNTRTGARFVTLLELFDLQSGRRLWQVIHPQISFDQPMEFSSDQQYLILLTSKGRFQGSLVVMNCATGEAETPLSESANERFRATGLVRSSATGRLLVAGAVLGATSSDLSSVTTEVLLKDALTGKSLYGSKHSILMDGQGGARSEPAQVFPSPDGMHIAVVKTSSSNVEIWNLQNEKLVVAAKGQMIQFDPNGAHALIAQKEHYVQVAGASGGSLNRISHVSLFDIPSGKQLCENSLAGDHADLVRFSPDGRRLLTLHGYFALGSAGAVAQGRLWDVESGREILAMPVAELNVYKWDLVFDSTGQRLTSVLFGKNNGTGGGGNSVVYDAVPLRAEDDARFIAGRLVDVLSRETPLLSEMRAEIENRTGLKTNIREAALAAVERIGLDVNRVANTCLEIVCEQYSTPRRFQDALRWALVLHQTEPKALRSRVLLGAAQFRCGLVREATVTLADPPAGLMEKSSDYAQLRFHLLELLAKRQADGNIEELQKLLTAISNENTLKNSYTSQDIMNVRAEVGSGLPPALFHYRFYAAPLNEETIAAQFNARDSDGNSKLTSDEVSMTAYRFFDKDRNQSIDLAEYGVSLRVFRLISPFNPENQKSPTLYLANLNEAIRLASEYPHALALRGRLLATSPDDTIRNGPQAVAAAMRACELLDWKDASCLDTLAAAYAETENFEEAIKRQGQAMTSESVPDYADYQKRLALYKEKKKYRENTTLATMLAPAVLPVTGNYSAPLLAADQVLPARRITGRDSAWSPDGKKIVRIIKSSNSDQLDLEIIDLDSGETTKLCQGAIDPAWSQLPGGSIAFTKVTAVQPFNPGQKEIWLVEPDGSNLRKLASGSFPSWSSDGRLFFQTVAEDKNFLLSAISPDMPDKPLLNIQLGTVGYAALSRDGKMVVRIAPSQLTIERLQPPAVLITLPLAPKDMGAADWSPDGRFVVYASGDTASPGLSLIEVSTGRKRLLTDLNLTRPRWSPDGKIIAVNDQAKSEILLLDVSGLDLSKGLQITPVPIKFGEPATESSSAQTGKDKS